MIIYLILPLLIVTLIMSVFFLAYGDGTFLSQRTYSTGSNTCPNSLASGDFNNDSLLDIIVTHSYTSTVGVFLGISYMNGLRENTYSTGSSPHPRAVAFGDFNKDTQLDIAIANYGLDNIGTVFGYAKWNFFNAIYIYYWLTIIPNFHCYW